MPRKLNLGSILSHLDDVMAIGVEIGALECSAEGDPAFVAKAVAGWLQNDLLLRELAKKSGASLMRITILDRPDLDRTRTRFQRP